MASALIASAEPVPPHLGFVHIVEPRASPRRQGIDEARRSSPARLVARLSIGGKRKPAPPSSTSLSYMRLIAWEALKPSRARTLAPFRFFDVAIRAVTIESSMHPPVIPLIAQRHYVQHQETRKEKSARLCKAGRLTASDRTGHLERLPDGVDDATPSPYAQYAWMASRRNAAAPGATAS